MLRVFCTRGALVAGVLDVKCTGIFVFSGEQCGWFGLVLSVCVLQKASFAFWTACRRAWGKRVLRSTAPLGSSSIHKQAHRRPHAAPNPKTATPSLLKCSRTDLFPSRSRPALFSVLFFCVAAAIT